ncbi:asparagine synthase-related protein [Candidatus Nitrosarchaeum limnium]|uniref:Asparagine synthetase domain-containing protein n=1 Tax=Candidatus Nitrosarchaeum limnium BG20 TaxID=859192 RepID=S2E798_9ARCH|nr:asparagine synthase-related protein [Candidatus Nitrosarchaeum limnium]EPA05351.1 hypothetical protein BG20_I0113 [Candidatus Nitrosarchaeum limnium BG20]
MSLQVNPLSIISILTLRYDLTTTSPIQKLNWTDFSQKKVSNPEKTVQDMISNYYLENLEKKSNVGISLSSGVDSTLLLALLKQAIPKLDVNSFSIRFSDSLDETKNAKKNCR